MLYYNNEISQKYPKLLKYFESGIQDDNKNISHCLLFWGPDIKSQCELLKLPLDKRANSSCC